MARKRQSRELVLWINGKRCAYWRVDPHGEHLLAYDSDWLQDPEGRPLSLSLPFSLENAPHKGSAVEFYFDNLLPESDVVRVRLQNAFRTGSRRAFDLLEAIGRDCIGAVQLLPPEAKPDPFRIEATRLTHEDIEEQLARTVQAPAGGWDDRDDFRISLAGMQEKSAFLWHAGHWCRPHGATPTSHIFKLPLGRVGRAQVDLSTSVENEWLCSRLLAAYNVPIANCGIEQFGRFKVLVVERFDRQLHSSGKYWLRFVQEDFCQASGMPASRKYESDGGPGIEAIARILRGSVERDTDLATLIKALICFWLLGAPDGHAKNFSIRILQGGYYRLTPLYDVISAWPVVGRGPNRLQVEKLKLAMALIGKNRHYLWNSIQRRHFNATAAACGVGRTAEPIMGELIESTTTVIDEVEKQLPAGFPDSVATPIFKGLKNAVKRLRDMPPE